MKMKEKVYIIFSRHELTEAQREEIDQDASQFGGIENCELVYLKELASKNIQSLEEAEEIYEKIKDTIRKGFEASNFVEIYGTIPVPIRFLMQEDKKEGKMIIVNESFNINRSKEGEKPTFEHSRWLPTGEIWIGIF